MADNLEKYLMEPTPFELTVGEFAENIQEDAQLLGKYAQLNQNIGNLIGSLFKLSPANAGEIIKAGVDYTILNKQYEEFVGNAPWKKINYYGKPLNFDKKGVGILGYRLDIAREYFSNVMKNPIFKIAMQQYRDVEDNFFKTFS